MIVISKHFRKLSLAAFLSLLCLGFSCDKPFEPVEPKDYPFYIGAEENPNRLFIFHPTTQKMDSVIIPWNPFPGVTASADGKLLYIAQGTSVAVVETDSFTLVTELLYPTASAKLVAVSPDNELVALLGGDLYILRTSDYSVVFSDTVEYLYSDGNFSSDSKTFYCTSRPDQSSFEVVYKLDLSDSSFPVMKMAFSQGSVTQVIPSIDESKWFLYLAVGLDTYSFEVYDVMHDSIVFRDVLVPGGGYETISPVGNYVFYTGPGRDGSTNDPNFKIFNIETNQIEEVVRDSSYYCAGVGCIAPRNLAISPDGRWLGILGGSALITAEFYVYDIKKRTMVYRVGLDTGLRLFTNISAQNGK